VRFDGIQGIIFGRLIGPDAGRPKPLNYLDAIKSVLNGLSIPVLFDADFGVRNLAAKAICPMRGSINPLVDRKL
jgi:muramoyltetrapeptide carboxypeptidase LdcA involved in peptidoglycan recycling